ncbi:MAG TPA: glycosyl hydrolase family 28 protein [Opitutaceae bacterium]|nr:glycosyl hydrolase family 28 protein [Opitutaceae bacterium]
MSPAPLLLSRRQALRWAAGAAAGLALGPLRARARGAGRRDFNVRDFGARGGGAGADTAAIQRAIDAAAAAGGRVVVPGGGRFVVGSLVLRGGIDFHLADDAELRVSARAEDYAGAGAVFTARDADGLSISGTGSVDGRSPDFMTGYDPAGEWWKPAAFRPRLFQLTGCRGLEVRGVTLRRAPSWTLHLVGCQGVLVDGIKIRNQLDVPNCDGIDPDHCRDVEIRGCDISCGDDAIVIKTTRQGAAHGPSSGITVKDCVLETQDSGVKIGTETTQDISRIRFERCTVKTGSRGLCIQLRDEGDISDVTFADITLLARCYADPWWGRGEALSLTAIPRRPGARIGRIRGVTLRNVRGRAENSARICGSPESRIRDVTLENVAVELDRWTRYPGGLWDNRPTSAEPEIERRGSIPVFGLRDADQVVLRGCRASWGAHRPEYFTHALEAERVSGLRLDDFRGEAARPGVEAVVQR